MKTRTLGRMGALALALCLITTCLLGGTLAQYTSTVTGTGTATVAAWAFKANDQATAFTFTMEGNAKDHKIAPGNSGTITLNLNNDSDVAADYDIQFTALPNDDANFTFKLTDADGSVIDNTKKITGSLLAGGEATVTIYWVYADIPGPTAAAGTEQTVTIDVTGTQSAATDPVSASVASIVAED